MRTPVIAIALTAALAVAACSGSDSNSSEPTGTEATIAVTEAAPTTEAAAPTGDAATTTEPAAVDDTTTTIDPAEAQTIEQINAYIDEAAAFDQATADAQFPDGLTFAAGGAPGYSRYVFRESSAGVVPK